MMVVNVHYSPGKMLAVPLTLAKCNPVLNSMAHWAEQAMIRWQVCRVWAPLSPPLQPHWQLLRVHLSTSPKLPKLSFMQLQWASAHSFHAPRGVLQAWPADGVQPAVWEASSQFVSWKHRRIQTTETENPAIFIKQSPVSTGGEEELKCCLLQALPCPTPVWTSGTKRVRAAPERLSPEPGQESQGEGGYGGFASKVHSLLYQSTTADGLQTLKFKGREGNLLSRK